jgi:EmrB/QacA subfamily drug resistance transporter
MVPDVSPPRTLPLVVAVALFMEQMDSTVIATALPAIAADIGTSPIALKLALTSYLVALAIFIPLSGWAADRFGARRLFASAIAVFVAGSLLCATAGSLEGFVAARFLQGMGGAMMTPVGRLLLVRGTPKAGLVEAMAWLTIPALVGPLMGPPLGGFLTTYASWHWIFLINLPVGIAGIAFALLALPRDTARPVPRVDWTGFVLAATAAAGIVFGLSVVSLPALPPAWGLAALMAGILAGALYLPHARRHPAPVVDLTLLRHATFRAAITGGNIFRIGVGAVPFLMPLMLQLGFGMTPFHAGMITLAAAAGAISSKFLVASVLSRTGFRTLMLGAVLASALTVAGNGTLQPGTPALAIMLLLFVGGMMRSLFFTAVNALAYADVEEDRAGQATSLVSAAQQVAVAIGVALAGGLLDMLSRDDGSVPVSAFHAAFWVLAAISAAAALAFLRLPPDAGAAAAGRMPPDPATGVPSKGP